MTHLNASYLTANERTEHFAWSIMTSFDAVQALGTVRIVCYIALRAAIKK